MKKLILISMIFAGSAFAGTFSVTNATNCVCTGYAAYGHCKLSKSTSYTLYSFDGDKVYSNPINAGKSGAIYTYKEGSNTWTDIGTSNNVPEIATQLDGQALDAGKGYVFTVNNSRTGKFDYLELSAYDPCKA